MSKSTKGLSLLLGLLIASPVFAADYNGLLSPSSLGQDINTLNSRYKLGLKKQEWGGYTNKASESCKVDITIDKNSKATLIELSPNTENCRYKATTSGVSFDSRSSKIVDILNQTKVENIQFFPGCFNCPSGLELSDSLVIKRSQDKYYTEYGIEGYNSGYLEFMMTKLLGKVSQDNYYPMLDKLEAKLDANPSLYNRKDFKLQAMKTYDLQGKPWNYAIGLK